MLNLRGAAFPLGLLLVAGPVFAQEPPVPMLGCYERTYDTAHLKRHSAQLIARATLEVKQRRPEMASSGAVAIGDLRLWIRKKRDGFQSYGACHSDGGALSCRASSSVYETGGCATQEDGATSGCRRVGRDNGVFRIEPRPEGVLVTISKPIEMHGFMIESDFLYLGPDNEENSKFLLMRREKCD